MADPRKNDRIWISGAEMSFAEAKEATGLVGNEIASRELQEWLPTIGTLPNPDPILRSMGKSISTYRNMVDAHLGSVRRKRIAAVKARPWILEDGKADAKTSKRVRTHLESLKMRSIVAGILDAVFYGYSVLEVVWDIVDGWIVPVRVVDKPQEWFSFGIQSQLQLRNRLGRFEDVPERKFLVATHQASYANPYGTPLLSECFWPLAFKKGGLKFWAQFCEKWGSAKAIGKVPASTSTSDKQKLARQLAGLIRDAVGVIPDNATIEVLEATGKSGSGDLYQGLVKWADADMSKSVLGETLTTEQGPNGARAATEVHNEVRGDLAQDDANLVEETMNTLIRWIYEINAPEAKDLPWFSVDMPKDLQEGRVTRDNSLYRMGLRFKPEYFVDTYGINPDHIDTIDNKTAQQGPAFAESSEPLGPGEGDIRKLLDGVTPEDMQGQIEQLINPIVELAEKQGTYAEFEDALDKAFPSLPFDKFQDTLEKLLLITEMKGRTDAGRNR